MSLPEQKLGQPDQDRAALINQEKRLRQGRNESRHDVEVSFAMVERFIKEFPQARATQSELLENLRKVGILDPIERLSGIDIPPIPFDHENHLYLNEQVAADSKESPTSLDGDVVYIPAPTLSNKYGIWQNSAKVYVLHTQYTNGEPTSPHAVPALVLCYTSELWLGVNGMSYIGHKLDTNKKFRDKVVRDIEFYYSKGFGPLYPDEVSICSDRRILGIHHFD